MANNTQAIKRIASIVRGESYDWAADFLHSIEHAVSYIEKCEEDRDSAVKQLKAFNKDEEIMRLKAEVKELRKGFHIDKDEWERINEWKQRHVQHIDGTSCGNYSYVFIPTNIGEVGIVKCNCGASYTFRGIE